MFLKLMQKRLQIFKLEFIAFDKTCFLLDFYYEDIKCSWSWTVSVPHIHAKQTMTWLM